MTVFFGSARRPGLTSDQMIEIIRAATGAGGVRPIPRQALANRYGVALEDINRILAPAPAKDAA